MVNMHTILTLADLSISHCGLINHIMPDAEPGRVTPRMNNTNNTKYGNVAVKYTTCMVKEKKTTTTNKQEW